MRSTLTTGSRARGKLVLEERGFLRGDSRETAVHIAAGAVADVLNFLGPADALAALREALDLYNATLRTGRLFPDDPTRDAMERLRAALQEPAA